MKNDHIIKFYVEKIREESHDSDRVISKLCSGGSSGGWLEPPSTSPVFKYPVKMK